MPINEVQRRMVRFESLIAFKIEWPLNRSTLTLILERIQYATVQLVAFEDVGRLGGIDVRVFLEELNNLKLVNVPFS